MSEFESDGFLPKFTPSEEFKSGRREERQRRRKEVEERKVRSDEERCKRRADNAIVSATARARSSVQDAPPP